MPTLAQTEKGYRNLYVKAEITPDKLSEVKRVADKIVANKATYMDIQNAIAVPWWWIGPVHNRESSLNFNTHLHCGDPLIARTVHVPKGRPVAPPKSGHFPYTFMESAIDALSYPPHNLKGLVVALESTCYQWERYNGWGYLGKTNTPYLYAATTLYHGGKYIADGVYSATAWDQQLGCVALLKELEARDPAIKAFLSVPQAMPSDLPRTLPKDPKFKDITKKENKTKAASAGGAIVGAGGEGAKQSGAIAPDNVIVSPFITWTLIGAGVGAFIIAVVLIAKKKNAILARWGG